MSAGVSESKGGVCKDSLSTVPEVDYAAMGGAEKERGRGKVVRTSGPASSQGTT